jgi:hypothetical protein
MDSMVEEITSDKKEFKDDHSIFSNGFPKLGKIKEVNGNGEDLNSPIIIN